MDKDWAAPLVLVFILCGTLTGLNHGAELPGAGQLSSSVWLGGIVGAIQLDGTAALVGGFLAGFLAWLGLVAFTPKKRNLNLRCRGSALARMPRGPQQPPPAGAIGAGMSPRNSPHLVNRVL